MSSEQGSSLGRFVPRPSHGGLASHWPPMIATTWEGAAADLADDLRIATTSLAKDRKGMCQSKSSGYSDCVSNPF